MNRFNDLERMASLIGEIEMMIGRQFDRGSVGEFIASVVFDIALERPGNIAFDGRFKSGEHKDRSVNVKWYGARKTYLDINADNYPDFYLVLKGSEDGIVTEDVYLFEAVPLILKLRDRGTKIGQGDPTSIRNVDWEEARLMLTEDQQALIRIFSNT